FVYRCRACAAVAANVPSGSPDLLRKEVYQWLDHVCDPAFRATTRHHASFVRLAGQTFGLINQDVLLSNGSHSFPLTRRGERRFYTKRSFPTMRTTNTVTGERAAFVPSSLPVRMTVWALTPKNE